MCSQQPLEVAGVAIEIGKARAGHLPTQGGAALAQVGQLASALAGDGEVVAMTVGERGRRRLRLKKTAATPAMGRGAGTGSTSRRRLSAVALAPQLQVLIWPGVRPRLAPELGFSLTEKSLPKTRGPKMLLQRLTSPPPPEPSPKALGKLWAIGL